ncbi:phage tail protein [Klebsiella aerogenes]
MSEYYVLITDAGAALQAAALANGTTVNLSSFGIDDGNGEDITPDAAQTALINQVYSGDISSLAVSTSDDSVLVAQCIVPATSGGYVIRGVGIYTDDGTLYAVGNFPDQSKPDADSGYAASLEILVNLAVSDTAAITLTVVAADSLTEEQADQLYLRQDKKLGEISAQGSSAQSVARTHLGLGDIATQRIANFLQVAKYLSEIAAVGTDAQKEACANIAALSLGGGTLLGELYLTNKRILIDEPDPGTVATGDYVTSEAYCWRLLGRGAYGDSAGATAKIYYREHVGSSNEVVVHINGFSNDVYFILDNGGSISAPGRFIPGDFSNFDSRYAKNPQSVGALGVGAYAMLVSSLQVNQGGTAAGSSLYSGGFGAQKSSSGWGDKSIAMMGGAMSGTWMAMGYQGSPDGADICGTIWYRIE